MTLENCNISLGVLYEIIPRIDECQQRENEQSQTYWSFINYSLFYMEYMEIVDS